MVVLDVEQGQSPGTCEYCRPNRKGKNKAIRHADANMSSNE